MPLRLMPRSLRHTHTPHPPPRPDSSWAHSSPLIPALGAFGALWDLLRGDPDPAGDGASSASIPGRGQGTAAVTCRMMSPSGLPPGLPGPFPNCSLGCFWPASAPGRVFTLCLEKKLPDPCLPPWEQAARGGVSLANHGERGCHGLPPSLGDHRLAWDIPLGGGGGGSLAKRAPCLLPVWRMETGIVAYNAPHPPSRSVPISLPPLGEAGALAARGRGAPKALRSR